MLTNAGQGGCWADVATFLWNPIYLRDGFRESITHGGVKIDNRLELLAKNQIKL
jgi:hypothetical protein